MKNQCHSIPDLLSLVKMQLLNSILEGKSLNLLKFIARKIAKINLQKQSSSN